MILGLLEPIYKGQGFFYGVAGKGVASVFLHLGRIGEIPTGCDRQKFRPQ